ncbi:hypothetical protein B0T11DRAFT_105719 [Plectosphaerella cucumerina]|uniref:Uncharacterized protein n=1 Tax=Plectosphaerella cucumerina TaxID=40658 RepID=A0A8K0TCU5_9PEZI|nr:hypothetical protein B0T11DRAFT_105719 [Plectosphaerella cucumerina]
MEGIKEGRGDRCDHNPSTTPTTSSSDTRHNALANHLLSPPSISPFRALNPTSPARASESSPWLAVGGWSCPDNDPGSRSKEPLSGQRWTRPPPFRPTMAGHAWFVPSTPSQGPKMASPLVRYYHQVPPDRTTGHGLAQWHSGPGSTGREPVSQPNQHKHALLVSLQNILRASAGNETRAPAARAIDDKETPPAASSPSFSPRLAWPGNSAHSCSAARPP